LEARGQRQNRVYMFSAATYRALGAPADHTRLHGVEPIQQEQLVLQYAATHGRITRSAVAELCQVGSVEARSLLRRLVRRGELAPVGTGRTTRYVWRSN